MEYPTHFLELTIPRILQRLANGSPSPQCPAFEGYWDVLCGVVSMRDSLTNTRFKSPFTLPMSYVLIIKGVSGGAWEWGKMPLYLAK